MPLKVLITSRSFDFQGGVANYVKCLLEYTDETLVSFSHVVVSKLGVSSPAWRRPLEYLTAVLRFAQAIVRTRPDVVHLNPSMNWRSLPLHLCLLGVTKLLRQSVYLFFHGWDDDVVSLMVHGTPTGRLLRGVLRWADYSSVLCQRFRDQLIAAGWQPARVNVTAPMVVIEAYQKSGNESRKDKKGEPFRVLFLSRLAPAKGMWVLVEAAAWVKSTYPVAPIQFIIAGDGPEFESLAARVQDMGLHNSVRLLGYVRGEEKYAAFRRADLFVFPSFYAEGFPVVVIEAMASGLPIIYTPVGALAEILGPENGRCIEVAELTGEALGREIWQLFRDQSERRAMTVANQRLAQRYDVGAICAQTADVYRRVVALE